VKTGAKKRRVSLRVDDTVAREFEIELADGEPDFWVFLDLAPFQGKKATVVVDKLFESSGALAALEVSDAIKGAENLYREPLRPQFHFSARRGWLNDPNGLVFSQGEYHLFFQLNPYGWHDAQKHWGHAVSPDLVHWRELPVALHPPRFGDDAWSGSAVVDKDNTSGFKSDANNLLVAAFTSTGRGECIVYSNDRGRTWTNYEGNPVVKHRGRDPRLLWHAPTKHWVMCLYTEDPTPPAKGNVQDIAFYTSPDLKKWTYQSRVSGFFECPDLFELPVDGDTQKEKWVLTAASSEYMIGSFDGREFKPETPKLPGHRGEAFYAAQTFTNEPRGRVVQIGWGQIAMPGMPFNQMMCFPNELALRTTPAGLRLCWQPVKEIESLRTQTRVLQAPTLAAGEHLVEGASGELLDIVAKFEPGTAEAIELNVRGVPVHYDARKQELVSGKHRAPVLAADNKIELRILVDRGLIEIYGNEGSVFMPIAAAKQRPGVSVTVRGGEAKNVSVQVHELHSAWEK
jgi:fructan beta-fructosidase